MELEKRWRGFGEPWNWLIIALIALSALCAMSCKSPNGLTQTHQQDSLMVVKKYEMNLAPVPMSVAKLAIPMGMLEALPIGAGYIQKSGQATVNVKKSGNDSIIITATCDSLARQNILLTEELTRIRNETSVVDKPPEVKMVNEPNGWQWFWIRTGQLAATIAGIYLVLKMIKRYINKKKTGLWKK